MAYFFLGIFDTIAQTKYKYLVLLKYKDVSPYSLNSPLVFLFQKATDLRFKQRITIEMSDIPPNPAYISSIQ